jgi:Bacterial lectin
MRTSPTKIGLIALTTALLCIQPAIAVQTYLTSDFTGTTADGWTFVTGMGAGPSLTAATGNDPVGDGWLRMTNNAVNQASFVYSNTAVPTEAGLSFNFDIVIYGNQARLADGIAFALFSTESTPTAGGYGGSLGYAQRSGIGGLNGGILGIGFDVFGNFSNGTEGRTGGVGQITNAIAIRGGMGATVGTGYQYLTGTGSLDSFSTTYTNNRDLATVHNVRITIPTDETITVQWKEDGIAEWTTLIDAYGTGIDLPDTLRFGFTAGTGSAYSFQEIRNFEVTSAGSLENIPEPSTLIMSTLILIPALLRRRRN